MLGCHGAGNGRGWENKGRGWNHWTFNMARRGTQSLGPRPLRRRLWAGSEDPLACAQTSGRGTGQLVLGLWGRRVGVGGGWWSCQCWKNCKLHSAAASGWACCCWGGEVSLEWGIRGTHRRKEMPTLLCPSHSFPLAAPTGKSEKKQLAKQKWGSQGPRSASQSSGQRMGLDLRHETLRVGTSLVVQWLRLHTPNAGAGFDPWSWNWISHTTTEFTCCN